jgi:hypothetical protein
VDHFNSRNQTSQIAGFFQRNWRIGSHEQLYSKYFPSLVLLFVTCSPGPFPYYPPSRHAWPRHSRQNFLTPYATLVSEEKIRTANAMIRLGYAGGRLPRLAEQSQRPTSKPETPRAIDVQNAMTYARVGKISRTLTDDRSDDQSLSRQMYNGIPVTV